MAATVNIGLDFGSAGAFVFDTSLVKQF